MSRITKACAQILTLVLTVAVAAVVAVVVLVAHGPVSLAPVTPYLETALAGSLGPYDIEIDDTILSWDGDADRIDLRAVNVRLVDSGSRAILSVPQMSVALSAGAAVRGRAVVTKVSLIRPSLSLLRDADGGLFLQQPESGDRWPLVINSEATQQEQISFGRLRHVAIVDAHITLVDAVTAASVVASGTTAELSVEEDRLVGRATARLRFADSEAAVGIGFDYHANLDADVGADTGGGLQAAVNFAELDVAALGRLFQSTPLAELQRFQIIAAGTVDVTARADGGDPSMAFDVNAGPGLVDIREFYSDALAVASLHIAGRARIDEARLEIEQLDLTLEDGPSFAIAGSFAQAADGFDVAATLTATPFSTDVLLQYWPTQFASGARDWVAGNIKAGTIANMKLALDLPAAAMATGRLPAEAVQLDWTFTEVTSTYLDDLPALQMGRGRGRVTGQRFDLQVDAAEVEGGLNLSNGRLAVPDLHAETPVLSIEFVTRGAASSVLRLLDMPPLGLTSKIGLDPSIVDGRSATATRLTLPLLETVTLDDIGYSAAATLTDVGLPDVWNDWDLRHGELTLKADNVGLQLNGTAQVNGMQVTLQWQRPIDSSTGDERINVRGTADVAQLTGLGFTPSDYAAGRVGLQLDLRLDKAAIDGRVELDLAAASISLPDLAWSKAAGQPARAGFHLRLAESGGVDLGNFQFSAPMLSMQGDASFDAAGSLVRLRADPLSLNGSLLAIAIGRGRNGVYAVRVDGERLDLRPFELDSSALKSSDREWPAETQLDANVRQVVVSDELVLTDVTATARRQPQRWHSADVSARLSPDAPARAVLIGTDYGYRLNFASSNAGAAARALGIYAHASGGQLYLKARIDMRDDAEDDIAGVLRADDFVLEDAPLLAQLLTLGSLRGINDAISGNGISFTRLELPFTMRGDVIEVQNGRAVGPALGLTGQLAIDRGSDSVRANGTLIPAYTINSMLGNIPLIGDILVGRKGEGVLALTFQIDGPVENPRITVNPLSALAPGFLRRIFEGLEQPAEGLGGEAAPDSGRTIDRRQ